MSRAKGCSLDKGKHRYTSFDLAKARGIAGLPASSIQPSFDLSQYAPPVMDQGQTGSCEGHSSAGAIATTMAALGKPLPWIPSPASIYTLARCIDRAGATSQPLQDVGTETNSVIRAISEFGVQPMGATVEGRFSDVSDVPSVLNAEPDLASLEIDQQTLVIGAYQITSTGTSRDNDVKTALSQGFAVRIDSFVDMAFENWSPGDAPFGVPDYNDPEGGGHALYIIGYTPSYYVVRNSWGDWGENGNINVSSAFVAQADVFAWKVSVA